jgi:CBS domain-containing protein
VSPLARFRVEDVMERDVPTIPADTRAHPLIRRLLELDPVLGRRHAWPLVDDAGALVGILTRGDLLSSIDREDAASENGNDPSVLEIGSRELVIAYADDLLQDAVDSMIRAGVARLPVVSRSSPTRLVGMVSRDALAAAYRAVLDEEHLRERGNISVISGAVRPSIRENS